MATTSFEQLRDELDAACASLRSFTLGQRRVTRKSGLRAIQLVGDVCDRLSSRVHASNPQHFPAST